MTSTIYLSRGNESKNMLKLNQTEQKPGVYDKWENKHLIEHRGYW